MIKMKFKYSIITTKSIKMPNGNRQVDYVHLTNNPNFVKEKMSHSAKLLIKNYKGREWIQFTDFAGHHIDTVRYENNTYLSTSIRDNFKERVMTEAEIHKKYRHSYIIDLD